jgi:hypothetical protein
MSAEGEWVYEPLNRQLLLHVGSAGISGGGGDLPPVRVPTLEVLVNVHGSPNSPVTNVSFAGLGFADSSFDAQGGQDGFNMQDWPPAVPSDAAIRVSDARAVLISNCTFTNLGGGGVHIGNRSRDVQVLASRFVQPGQSGVIMTGNSSAQAQGVLVEGCTFESPGTILASAAGIMGTTVSMSTFRSNNISNSSRWGIAVRSNGDAGSLNNLIELNRIENSGQKSRDLGAISLMGSHTPGTRSVIRSNCVLNTVGTDTNKEGRLLRPFFSWSVYLDNNASGYAVEGNVLHGNVNGGLFFHGGGDNLVHNNVFAGTSGYAPGASEEGDYGYWHAGSIDYGRFGNVYGGNNSVERNIILSDTNQSLWTLNVPLSPNRSTRVLSTIDRNLYFSSVQRLASMRIDRAGQPPFTWPDAAAHLPNGYNGTWGGWQQALGYDVHGVVDVAPGFRDAAAGDFTLVGPSAAAARLIGFKQLDANILPC